jgi:hypothetical protein
LTIYTHGGYVRKSKNELKPHKIVFFVDVFWRERQAMKHRIILLALIIFSSGAVQAREQQVYNPYAPPVYQSAGQQQSQQYQYEAQQIGTRRVYPGREIYGDEFGPMPRHPGDYRDAVDRGSWTGGGQAGARSFSID